MVDITFNAEKREKAGKGQLGHVVVKDVFLPLSMAENRNRL